MPEVQPTLENLGFINIAEIAEILGVTRSVVLRIIKVGLIETYKFGLGSRGISRASVEEYYRLHIWPRRTATTCSLLITCDCPDCQQPNKAWQEYKG